MTTAVPPHLLEGMEMNFFMELIINPHEIYPGNLAHYLGAVFYDDAGKNGYHNFRHSTDVTCAIFRAIRFYKNAFAPFGIRNLLITGLTHDYNHSNAAGPRTNDRLEIMRTWEGLERIFLSEDRQYLDIIKMRILRATEFSSGTHVVPKENLDLEEGILRDADVLQCLGPVWIQQIIYGLGNELGFAPLKMLQDQIAFLEGLYDNFCTEWARVTYPRKVINQRIAEVKVYLYMLEKSPFKPGLN